MKKDNKKIIQIVLFPVIVFVFNRLVNMPFDLYSMFPWLDIPMHFIGGVSIGVSASLLLRYQQERSSCGQVNRFFCFFWIIGIVSLMATLWEFYEFTSDYFFHTEWQIGVADTTGDLFFGLVGGSVAGLYLIHRLYRFDHNKK